VISRRIRGTGLSLHQIPRLAAFRGFCLRAHRRITERTVEAAHRIFLEGDVGDELLILRRGAVEIFLAGGEIGERMRHRELHDESSSRELSFTADGGYPFGFGDGRREKILLCLEHTRSNAALQSIFPPQHVITVLWAGGSARPISGWRIRVPDVRDRLATALADGGTRLASYRGRSPAERGISDRTLLTRFGATTSGIQTELIRLQMRELVIKALTERS